MLNDLQSLKKTNILAQDAETPPVITINNTELEVADSFTYLGSTVSSKALLDVEISSRIAKAAGVMAKLNKRVWTNDLLSERTKLQVYRSCVLSTLLYGSEHGPHTPDKRNGSTGSTSAAFGASFRSNGRTESPTPMFFNKPTC